MCCDIECNLIVIGLIEVQSNDEKEKKQNEANEANEQPANDEDLNKWQRAEVTAASINNKDAILPGKINHKQYVSILIVT